MSRSRASQDHFVKVVNMLEAARALSQLVEQAEKGEEVIIARDGQPVAKIVALRSSGRRTLGQWLEYRRIAARLPWRRAHHLARLW